MLKPRNSRSGLRASKSLTLATAVRRQSSHNNYLGNTLPRRRRQQLVCKESPNDFGENANQCLICRRDSTGTELSITPSPHRTRSHSFSNIRPATAARLFPLRNSPISQAPLPTEPLHTYYPLHQGPSISITSADGTTLYAETESDSARNAAAQCLFRALVRRHSAARREILDGHMDKIFGSVRGLGAVALSPEVKDLNAHKEVVNAMVQVEEEEGEMKWAVKSICAVVEGVEREMEKKEEKKGKGKMWKRVLGWKKWRGGAERVLA